MPCPEIEPAADDSARHVVTATFRHSAGNLVDLFVDEEKTSIGVTDNHPYWSVDRQAFVAAGQLRLGESLQSVDGTVHRVSRITPRRGPPVEVFNLEVDAQHVYYVGSDGILVHNTYPSNSITLGLADHLEDFTKAIRAKTGENVGMWGSRVFDALIPHDDTINSQWAGIAAGMRNAKTIHFNLQDFSWTKYGEFVEKGKFRWEPVNGLYTQRELYEILNDPQLFSKTEFYDGLIPWKWSKTSN